MKKDVSHLGNKYGIIKKIFKNAVSVSIWREQDGRDYRSKW